MRHFIKPIRLAENGIAHIIMPALVVVIIGAIGGYVYLYGSHAATTCYAQQWKQGSSGQCVKDVQNLLNYQLYSTKSSKYLSVDGQFGSYTKSAVQQEEKNSGITVDGVVGASTWQHLCAANSSTSAPSWYISAANNAGCPTATSSSGSTGGSTTGGKTTTPPPTTTGSTGGSATAGTPFASALSGYKTLTQSYTGQQMATWAGYANESQEGGHSCSTADTTYDSANSAVKMTTNGTVGGSCGDIRSPYTAPTKNSVIESKILLPGSSATHMLDWGSFWTDGAIKANTSNTTGSTNENWPITGEVDAVETQFGQSYVSIHCGCRSDYNPSTNSTTDWTTEPNGWEGSAATYGTGSGSNVGPAWTVVDIAFNSDGSASIYYNGSLYTKVPATAMKWNTGFTYVVWGIGGPGESSSSWPGGAGAEEAQYLKVFTP